MRRYSPPYYSPPRRGYGGRPRSPPRSPPRRGYGGDRGSRRHRDQNHGSLLVRNIPLDCRAEELRVPFERFGLVRDVYLPKDYYTGVPRGFAFVQFVDPYDAAEAQYHMNGKIFAGREISVVLAAETRKRPEEMRRKSRTGRGPASYGDRRSSYYEYSQSHSPPRYASGSRSRHRSRSYSPAPRRQSNYSISPERRHAEHPKSPRNHPQEQDFLHNRRSYSPGYDNIPGQNYDKNADHKTEEARTHWRSPPGRAARSPSGSRSRSADISPRRNI